MAVWPFASSFSRFCGVLKTSIDFDSWYVFSGFVLLYKAEAEAEFKEVVGKEEGVSKGHCLNVFNRVFAELEHLLLSGILFLHKRWKFVFAVVEYEDDEGDSRYGVRLKYSF